MSTKQRSIAIIGGSGDGKSTLLSAISNHIFSSNSDQFLSLEEINSEEETNYIHHNGRKIKASELGYMPSENSLREVNFVDFRGHDSFLEGVFSDKWSFDLAILVVNPFEGLSTYSREQLIISRAIGIKEVICFINKFEDDEESLNAAKEELIGDLEIQGYNYDEMEIYEASASEALTEQSELAKIGELVACIEAKVLGAAPRDFIGVLTGAKYSSPSNQEIHYELKVRQGTIRPGVMVDMILREKAQQEVIIESLELYQKGLTMDFAEKGTVVGAKIRGLEGTPVLAATKDTLKVATKVEVACYLHGASSGGNTTILLTGSNITFAYGDSLKISATINHETGDIFEPGSVNISATLSSSVFLPYKPGLNFAIISNGEKVGYGFMVKELA